MTSVEFKAGEDDSLGKKARELLMENRKEEWNVLRSKELDWMVIQDFSLRSRNCEGWDFSRCQLIAVDFSYGNFCHANFTASNLLHCQATGTQFEGAILEGAHVQSCDFGEANLRNSHLSESIWSRQSVLTLADFEGSDLSRAAFIELDTLHLARNLQKATSGLQHNLGSGSSIDFQTLEFCERLPDSLLRACALPSWLRQYYTTGREPSRPPRVFLSYATEDHAELHHLLFLLRDRFASPFHDRRDGHAGAALNHYLPQQIEACELFLVLLTSASVASHWVRREVSWALDFSKPIIPVVINFDEVNRKRWVKELLKRFNYVQWQDDSEERALALLQIARALDQVTKPRRKLIGRRKGNSSP
ncbi:MAG TPA: toll/interleukin-1 receptor domain-containing protein [Verrucomicrobiota bacterium]|nr:toll/interleukin-1 receptor domain-containing protein [Verrucomicrobiota bacterium]